MGRGNWPAANHAFRQTDYLLKAAAAIGNEFEAGVRERGLRGSGDLVNLLLDEASSGGIAKSLEQGA